MSRAAYRSDAGKGSRSGQHERRLESLIERLPKRAQACVHWLRRPSSRWVRIPAAVLLMAGGFLGFLPVLGVWMLPLGLVLLAEDLPPLRRAVDCVLEWLEQRRPRWFKQTDAEPAAPSASSQPSISPDAWRNTGTPSARHVSARH